MQNLNKNNILASSNTAQKFAYSPMGKEFIEWFVGFSDGESSFNIVPNKKDGRIYKFNFVFRIGLHIDDIDALLSIQKLLGGIGNVTKSGDEECRFTVSDKKGIEILMTIFDQFNLNTTKYLDYLNFKSAFILYHSRAGLVTSELIEKLVSLKNGMNTSRTYFDFPEGHKIQITKHWLLGLIEGEGSFNLFREGLYPNFSLVLTERQQAVIIKIKEYLVNNLGFDDNSAWVLEQTPVMGVHVQKARGVSKPAVRFIIKNLYILQNYFLPFFDRDEFLTKKGKDYSDLKLICQLKYNGAHCDEEIAALLLKLSYTMNNFRLSNAKEAVTSLTSEEMEKLKNCKHYYEYLLDGRVMRIDTKEIVEESNLYLITTPEGELTRSLAITDTARIIGVNYRTLRSHLGKNLEGATLKNFNVKRVKVFIK